MSKLTPVRSLNRVGIERFARFVTDTRTAEKAGGRPLPPPLELLSAAEFLEPKQFAGELDASCEFDSRYELGAYLVAQFGVDFVRTHYRNAGVWSWLALAWFEQLRARKTQRHEHFIPWEWFADPVAVFGTPQPLGYRHSVRTAMDLVARFGDRARLFMSPRVRAFGDAGEQVLSRGWLKSSARLHELLYDLYRDRSGFMRRNALDKPPPAERAGGSHAGYGGVRRLVEDVLPRVKLTHDIDVMTPTQIRKTCGAEFEGNGPTSRRRSRRT